MDITITARNFDLTEDIKEYIHKKLDKVEKLYKRIYNCEVVLEYEKIRRNAEIILYLKRNKIVAKESSTDLFASIDLASESVKKQLRRLNGRIHSRRRRTMLGKIMGPFMGVPDGEDELPSADLGTIVKTDAFADKPMLPEEAKLELDLMGMDFMMFRNADTGENNVIYRRADNNYGLIEPKF